MVQLFLRASAMAKAAAFLAASRLIGGPSAFGIWAKASHPKLINKIKLNTDINMHFFMVLLLS
jgi:hypothetical protein